VVSAELKSDKYLIKFKGKKQQFNEYINKVTNMPNREYDFKEKCWTIPRRDLPILQSKFKDIEFLEEVQDLEKPIRDTSTYAHMGKHMKLQPYDYQKEAIKFGVDSQGILIVYPCGSGKTPIGIGIFDEAKRAKVVKGPGLIVVKASLKTQWLKEIMKFSDYKVKIIETTADVTASIADKIKRREANLKKGTLRGKPLSKHQIAQYKDEIEELQAEMDSALSKQFDGYDLFVLNYETLNEEAIRKELRKRKIDYIFADEIHYVKSHDAKRSKALHEFGDVKLRIGATATPVKKDYQDIFGIFKFVQPTLFSSFSSFAKLYIKYAGFGKISGFKNTDHLQKKIAPYIIVKTKEEISDQLPSLLVMQRYCDLYPEQQDASDMIMQELDELNDQVRKIRASCFTQADIDNNPELGMMEMKIMGLQTFAQEIADSPRLLQLTDSQMAKSYAIDSVRSSKLEMMADLVEEIINSGEKVCIFSKFERMHNILAEKILSIDKTIKIARVSGSMSDKHRYAEIYDKFRDNDEYKVLLGTDAMAEGANLSKCQYLIEFDLAESFAVQTQRHGRLERADSIHDNVTVYQLIANNSWDEIQAKIVAKKEGYDTELIKSLSTGRE
jgi:SNF2 family DNA or RNA helicase